MGYILSSQPTAENLIEEVIGRDAYMELCAWCGGTTFYVPSDPENAQGLELERAIGAVAARRLIRWAGSSLVYVPSRFTAELIKRRDEIMALRNTGKTVQEIARSYTYQGRYTERQLWRIINTPRDEFLKNARDAL